MEIEIKLRCLFKNDFMKRKKQIILGIRHIVHFWKKQKKKTKNLWYSTGVNVFLE
jgi:hypothetical protein